MVLLVIEQITGWITVQANIAATANYYRHESWPVSSSYPAFHFFLLLFASNVSFHTKKKCYQEEIYLPSPQLGLRLSHGGPDGNWRPIGFLEVTERREVSDLHPCASMGTT